MRSSGVRIEVGFSYTSDAPARMRRLFGPSRAPRSTPPTGRCPDIYAICQTRFALFILDMMRASIKNRPDLPTQGLPATYPGRGVRDPEDALFSGFPGWDGAPEYEAAWARGREKMAPGLV